jgi:hypothetical protein
MASGIYNNFKASIMNKEIDLEADSIKCMLMDNVHAFTATHNVLADVIANELAAAGNYTTGGDTLTTKAVTKAATTYWDADDPEWLAASFTAYHAVIYDITYDCLICSIDLGGAQTVTAGTLTILLNAVSGILSLT